MAICEMTNSSGIRAMVAVGTVQLSVQLSVQQHLSASPARPTTPMGRHLDPPEQPHLDVYLVTGDKDYRG